MNNDEGGIVLKFIFRGLIVVICIIFFAILLNITSNKEAVILLYPIDKFKGIDQQREVRYLTKNLTIDNSRTINSYTNNFLINNKTIIIPDGDYYISSSIVVKENIKLTGNNVRIFTDKNITMVKLEGSNAAISSLVLDGGDKANTGILVEECTNNIIVSSNEICNIKNINKSTRVSGITISANNCKNIIIEKNYVHNIETLSNGKEGDIGGQSRGILIVRTNDNQNLIGTDGVKIYNNRIEHIYPHEDGDGIALYMMAVNPNSYKKYVRNINIKNNRFNYCAKRAVKIMTGVVNVAIENNIIFSPFTTESTAMYSGISAYDSDVRINNNILIGNYFINGIEVSSEHSNMKNVFIENNVLNYSNIPNIDGTKTKSIFLFRGQLKNVFISKNFINTNCEYGIITVVEQKFKFEDLRIYSNVIRRVVDSSISINDTVNNVTITNNILNRRITTGSWSTENSLRKNFLISDNIINDNSHEIIKLKNTSEALVYNNFSSADKR